MLNDPKFKKVVDKPHKISRDFDIPYVAGYSKDGTTIYIDRDLPDTLPNGRPVIPHIIVHEKTEKTVEDIFKVKYQEAHRVAIAAEHKSVESAGISWSEYSRFIDKYVKLDKDKKLVKVPHDLDLKPYVDERDNRLLFRLRQKM
jgi:hypothetical protein